MAAVAADRDLLFGLLALQNGLIDQVQLVAAFQARTRDKGRRLAEHLVARGDLDADQRAGVDAMVTLHLKKHGGDAAKSLAAVPAGRSTRESLAQVGGADLDASLALVSPTSAHVGEDTERTATYSVGTATSDGQRFRVLRPHARGGLGAVFVALDSELHREVALKQILDQYADDPISRQRFLLEGEVTGGLEHPGIVPVYGLGTYADGRPYYAMRFIKGDTLKEAIDHFHADASLKRNPGRRTLELRKLLRRFIDVCNAIDYAHSRGVLHRDIKPGNIIVGKHGETLVVDWGLAKPIGRVEPGHVAGERTLMPSSASGSAETLPGSALGTPAYMSPEQASGDLDRLERRSDVYSLGATLYCLRTGRPAFEGDDLGEVLRRVQRGDFVPPRQFDPSLDKALEAVCLKAMANRPEDRYSSCRALAEDLERWMADEPVSAWREPWTRTLVRWLTRHRVSFTAAGAAVLAALAGTAAVLAVQTRANAALQAANSELAVANMKVTRANVDLATANDRERERFALAQEAIRTFHSGVSEDVLLKQKEFDALRTKLLRGARDFYRRLENLLQGQADRVSRKALGRAYLEVAEITATIESREAAVAIARNAAALFEALSREDATDVDARRELARSWNLFARHRYGQDGGKDESRTAFARVRQLLEPQANAQSPDAQALGELAYAYETLAFDLNSQTGHVDEGLELMSRARGILEDLAKAEPSDVQLLSRLASLCSTQGLMLSSAGRLEAAISTHERGRDILEGLVRANPTDAKIGHDLVRALANMAVDVDRRTGPEDRESLAILERSLAVCEDMAKANPTVLNFPRDKAWIDLCLANTLIGMGREQEARPRLEEARTLREQLLKTNPNDIRNQTQLHQVLLTLGVVHARSGRLQDAREAGKHALEVRDRLTKANRDDHSLFDELASDLTNTSQLLCKEGQAETARDRAAGAAEGFRDAIAVRERLVKEHSEVPLYRGHLAYTLRRLAQLEQALGDPAAAVANTTRAVSLIESMPDKNKDDELWWEQACGHSALASLAGIPGSGLSTELGLAEADRAMVLLQKRIHARARWFEEYRDDPALASLRDRADFKLLLLDRAMPTDPFSHSN